MNTMTQERAAHLSDNQHDILFDLGLKALLMLDPDELGKLTERHPWVTRFLLLDLLSTAECAVHVKRTIDTSRMSSADFTVWRKSLKLTQSEAAHLLNIGKRTVATYESTGAVPLVVALACRYIATQQRREINENE